MNGNKFLDAALKETGLPDELQKGLIAICLTAPKDGVHRSPEYWADVYMGGNMAFPASGLFDLQKRDLLEIAFGFQWYAILRVRGGRLKGRPQPYRPPIPADIAREVWKRDGELCAYCGDTAGPFHLDHITPWSRGGRHSVDNLTVSCAPCNLQKGDRTPEEMGWYHG